MRVPPTNDDPHDFGLGKEICNDPRTKVPERWNRKRDCD